MNKPVQDKKTPGGVTLGLLKKVASPAKIAILVIARLAGALLFTASGLTRALAFWLLGSSRKARAEIKDLLD